jgi:hypothetical protein
MWPARPAPVEFRFSVLSMSSEAANSGSTSSGSANPDPANPSFARNSSETDPEDRAITKTVECAACGRRFVGDYCPGCGRKAEATASTGGIVEDLLRELFDIERGFLDTLRALTLRPGLSLREYLDGDRSRLMSPGRYLLAVVVINFAVYWGLGQAGFFRPQPAGDLAAGDPAGGLKPAFGAFFNQQEASVLVAVVLACLLAAALNRLFDRQIRGEAAAVALGSYLIGHTVVLSAGAGPLVAVGWYLAAGLPPPEVPSWLYAAVAVPYVWGATRSTFDSEKCAGLKAAVGVFWATAEFVAVSTVAFCGWGLWIWQMKPTGAPEVDIPPIGLATTGGVALGAILLHAGAEAYYHLR